MDPERSGRHPGWHKTPIRPSPPRARLKTLTPRAGTLGRIATELAHIDPDRALGVADQIDDPQRKADALAT